MSNIMNSHRVSPLIIAHRGASGYRPEHTLAAYDLAIEQGADYIEPDLVITKDGILIARHENELSDTTDVATKFPGRKTTKKIDGKRITGWFAEDFTLSEIKTLRTQQRIRSRDRSYDFKYEIPTFSEILELAKLKTIEKKRKIGIYPETKHPAYFKSIGLPLEKTLVSDLTQHGFNHADAPVFIQSFELRSLRLLKTLTPVKLIFLIDQASQATPQALAELKSLVYGIGPSKRLLKPTRLVQNAHAAGLKVHPYTFRSDPKYLHRSYQGDPVREYLEFFALGVDGVFTDFPDQAKQARDLFLKSQLRVEE